MKIIHGSLSALLVEVKEHGKVDGVRVAALMQSTIEGAGIPRYTSWVIVSAHVDWEKWAEWRLVVGRQRAEVTEHGFRVPDEARRAHRGEARRGARLDRGGGARDARRHPRRRRGDPRRASWAEHARHALRGPPAPTTSSSGAAPSTSTSSSAASPGTSTGCSAGSARRPTRARARLRTSWPIAGRADARSARTTSSKLCRSLKEQGLHRLPRASRPARRLVEVAIDKFPLRDGTYTALGAARGRAAKCRRRSRRTCRRTSRRNSRPEREKSSTSLGGRSRSRKRSRSSLRVRSADACHRHQLPLIPRSPRRVSTEPRPWRRRRARCARPSSSTG